MVTLHRQIVRMWRWLFGKPPKPVIPAEPTDWCLVGNIVEEHKFGEAKEIRRGSKPFAPGTKVYCLPPQWGDGYEKVVAVGIVRGSRRWITVVLPSRLITNWRAKVVYKPSVLRRLREGFNGFNRQWKSQKEVESWVESLRRNGNTMQYTASPELIGLWKDIGADLRRARDTLPPEVDGNSAVREYQDFLDHNELELACDMLEALAEEHPVSREFWLALRDASMKMQLHDRAARYDGIASPG